MAKFSFSSVTVKILHRLAFSFRRIWLHITVRMASNLHSVEWRIFASLISRLELNPFLYSAQKPNRDLDLFGYIQGKNENLKKTSATQAQSGTNANEQTALDWKPGFFRDWRNANIFLIRGGGKQWKTCGR